MVNEDKRLNEVIRVKRHANNFVMMDKGFLENENLSWKAKGILAYLLSKPDNWKVIVGNVVNHATDGKTAVYNGLKELSEQGYYVKRPIRNEKGTRIVQWESIVFEMPEDSASLENSGGSLLPDFQEIENLDIGNQDIENRPLINNYINNNYNTKNQSSQSVRDGQDGMEEREKLIKQKIDYDSFSIARPYDLGIVDEIVAIVLDVLLSDSPYVVIGGENKPRELVKRNLLKLDYSCIEHVLDQFKSQPNRIIKKKQYLLTMLYNCKLEMDAHYTNWVQSDMRNGGAGV